MSQCKYFSDSFSIQTFLALVKLGSTGHRSGLSPCNISNPGSPLQFLSIVACSTMSSSSSPSLAVARDEPAPAGFASWVRSSDCPQAWSQQLLLRILLPLALGSCAGTSFPLNLFHNYRFFFPVFPVAYCQCLLVSEPPGTLRRNTN